MEREVPIARNTSQGCPLFGTYEPWSSEKILSLYRTKEAYVSQVETHSDSLVDQGFLLPEDRDEVMTEADELDVWSEGAALCHLEAGFERVESPVVPCPPSSLAPTSDHAFARRLRRSGRCALPKR